MIRTGIENDVVKRTDVKPRHLSLASAYSFDMCVGFTEDLYLTLIPRYSYRLCNVKVNTIGTEYRQNSRIYNDQLVFSIACLTCPSSWYTTELTTNFGLRIVVEGLLNTKSYKLLRLGLDTSLFTFANYFYEQ